MMVGYAVSTKFVIPPCPLGAWVISLPVLLQYSITVREKVPWLIDFCSNVFSCLYVIFFLRVVLLFTRIIEIVSKWIINHEEIARFRFWWIFGYFLLI